MKCMLCEKETTQGIELYVNGVLKKITLCEQCLMKVSLGINLFPLLFASFLQTFDNVNKQELIQNPDTNEPMNQCVNNVLNYSGCLWDRC